MNTKKIILKELALNGIVGSGQLVKKIKISRQAVAKHLKSMVMSGEIVKTGSTRGSKYSLNKNPKSKLKSQSVKMEKKLAGLQEDLVFDEIKTRMNLQRQLPENVSSNLNYAFTEMLNNAIDHSLSLKAKILFEFNQGDVVFCVADAGVGIFKNVMDKFKLNNEYEAVEHILKGKQTTLPSRHSGQGIFFTSRIADLFTIQSHKIKIIFDNHKNDIFMGEERYIRGTRVTFNISAKSKKLIKNIFDKFANKDFDFDRTDYKLKLIANREYLSRSQAKRILAGMEKFHRITFDFNGVKYIGQAFAHEIFVVFQRQHPRMELTFCNANQAITSMVLRVIREAN